MTQPTFHDVELISAYLDGHLSGADTARLEALLKTDEQYRQLLYELSQSRSLLRQLPARRAPRNFMLTTKMAGLKPPVPRAFPIFRFASAVMALLFLFAYAANMSVPAYFALRAAAPPVAFGRGGGGGSADANPPAANIAPMAAAPSIHAESATATPQVGMFAQPAPTQSASGLEPTSTEIINGLLPPTQPGSEPGPTFTQEPAPTEAAVPPGSAAKIIPNTQPTQPERTPIRLPVPAGLQFGLLGLALISGMTAFFVRARADSGWFKMRAVQPARLERRQVILIILAVLIILALILSILWISTTTFYADVPQTIAMSDKALPPPIGADKVLGPAVSGSDKGGAPASGPQFLTLESGLGYTMYRAEPSGLLTAIDFPANVFPAGTTVTYTPDLGVNAPTTGTVFPDRAFLLSVPPEGGEPSAPITISLDYGADVASRVDENSLALYWWSGSDWVDAAGTCSPFSTYERSPDLKRFRVNVCKLGSFILIAPATK